MDATLLGVLGTIIAWTAGAGRNTKTDNPSSVIVISSFRSRCQAQPNLEIDDGLPLARGAMRCATQGLRASPPLPPHYTTSRTCGANYLTKGRFFS